MLIEGGGDKEKKNPRSNINKLQEFLKHGYEFTKETHFNLQIMNL